MPRNSTPEELQRIIGGLNSNFGLSIQSSSHSPKNTSAVIYKKIHYLHYQDRDTLSACLGRFYVKARRLLQQAVPQPFISAAFRPQSASCKEALENLLLETLTAATPRAPSQKQGKRISSDAPVSQAKRPRSREKGDLKSNAVDDLPVRSRCIKSPASFAKVTNTIHSYYQVSGKSAQSTPTKTPSAMSIFTASATEETAESETTVDDDEFDDDFGSLSMSAKLFEDNVVESLSKEMQRNAGNRSCVYENDDPRSLDQRLKSVLSSKPIPGLNEAPLAVIWEATRILQHCQVDPEDYPFTYQPNNSWHNQDSFRAMHKTGPFEGKGLPIRSEDEAWNLALRTFQSKGDGVTLSAALVVRTHDTGPLMELRLNPMKTEVAHRLGHRFGGDRFLEVNMPSPRSLQKDFPCFDNVYVRFIRWLVRDQSNHHFLGRTWSAFFTREPKAKPQSGGKQKIQERVYFFAVNGNTFKAPASPGMVPPLDEATTPETRTTFTREGLLNWAISMQESSKQPFPKLFSRIALCLSRAIPTVTLERHQIRRQKGHVGTHQDMNDGIARMSRNLAKQIATSLGLSEVPTAFQGRFGCAKGMWVVDVDDDGIDGDVWIETFKSQEKWSWNLEDPLHRRFEVKAVPKEAEPARLNRQFITVLEAQAVDPEAMRNVIAKYLENHLLNDLGAQEAAMSHPAEFLLWLTKSSLSKSSLISHGHVPFQGGLPKSDEEALALLLGAGFDHKKLKYIQDIAYAIGKRKADHLKDTAHVRIPQSANMLMVADFSSSLEEGEVHVSFSSKFQVEGFCDTLLEGMDVLVGRSPAHLPSDVQRVKVVSHPKLRMLKDVIVFSTKGKRPLADLLSGGDYDGDRAWVCWDRDIVNNFVNSPVPDCPDLVKSGYLRKLDLTVQDLSGGRTNAADACTKFMYLAFLFNMQGSQLGSCTKYKDRLSYQRNSVKDREIVILSNLLGHLVDQRKQGFTFWPDDWARFRDQLLKTPKFLGEPQYNEERTSLPSSTRYCHILDFLKFKVANETMDGALEKFEKAIRTNTVHPYDSDLFKMFNHYKAKRKTPLSREKGRRTSISPNSVSANQSQLAATAGDGADVSLGNCASCSHRKICSPSQPDGSGRVVADEYISNTWDTLLDSLVNDIDEVKKEWDRRSSPGKSSDGEYGKKVTELHQMWMAISPPEEIQSTEPVQMLMEGWNEDANSSLWTLLKASATFSRHYKYERFTWSMAGRSLCWLKFKATRIPGDTAGAVIQPEIYAALRPDKKFIAARSAQREIQRENESVIALNGVTDYDDDGVPTDDV
ncbi:hypothetical protein HIM_04112 [Hirsutella minnesotensis 3608]|uniref:RNA-dependent RNA polymerase n=1 Tax=Hirsutella minnesotensis 3608 TaxID=1043627 RepID=A0A0F7ZVC7_9HYPO|nr:hypothetical protein HIM_04112 [Hirsutella minnesotensis 3608]